MGLHHSYITHHNDIHPHYFLCHYLPASAGKDNLSRSLLRFKAGRHPDLDGWIDCALEMLSAISVPPGSLIIRALHHHETILPPAPGSTSLPLPPGSVTPDSPASPPAPLQQASVIPELSATSIPAPGSGSPSGTPLVPSQLSPRPGSVPPAPAAPIPASLDLLGQALATHFHSRYLPQLLQKSAPCLPLKELSRDDRQQQLRGLYSLNPLHTNTLGTTPSLLLLDDILTSGTTIRVILDTLPQPLPPISIFTLARAGNTPHCNRAASIRGQQYQLGQQADWMAAEDPFVYKSSSYIYNHQHNNENPDLDQYTLTQLKTKIYTDTF